jgi:uncharacterized protein
MIEKEMIVDSHGNQLSGTLCLPGDEGSFPLVMMVHGSGPLDRDENMPEQQLNVFNTIAHHLAEQGTASYRYDKRGCGKSTGDYYTAGYADLLNDAVNVFYALKQDRACDYRKIFVLGHSEGCLIAPQMTAARPEIAGLILLCPFVDQLESILIKQAAQVQLDFESLPGIEGLAYRIQSKVLGTLVSRQKKLIEKLKSTDQETIQAGSQKIPARWLRELMSLDPLGIFSQVSCPMLLIGGEKDLQCDPEDVDRIARLAKGDVSARRIENLTHVLRFDEGKPSLLGSAKLLGKPMEKAVLDLISSWLVESLKLS